MDKERKVKKILQQRHGSLRRAAKNLNFSYFRLSSLCGGYYEPNEHDLKMLGLKKEDFKIKKS